MFLFYKCSLRHPRFPWVVALTRSVFMAAGSLSALFTHITGVKRGRFYNEVQWFIAGGYQDAVRDQKLQPFVAAPGEISGLVSAEGELSMNSLKWYKITCTCKLRKTCQHCVKKYKAHNLKLKMFIDLLLYFRNS